MTDTYILYGGPLSYYTGKARAYLTWKGVNYEERLATRDIYASVIIPRIGYPMIPLVITLDDEAIQDTTEIIDYFEARDPEPSVFPETPRQRFAAHLFELYGDEWLLIPAMHYRWAHNRDFAYAEFGKLAAPGASEEDQYAAGKVAAQRFQGAVPMLGATPEMAGAIEASYEALLDELEAHFSVYDYLFGGRPSIGDFGFVGPLYAHLYRDPASGDLMKSRAPSVARWVERMQKPTLARGGTFLANDEIPETLLPILRRMGAEQVPCLVDLVEKLAAWKRDNPETDIPRVIGMHPFTVGGKTGTRIIIPYTQWMLQRALGYLETLDEDDSEEVSHFAAQAGVADLVNLKVTAPVARQKHKLIWAN